MIEKREENSSPITAHGIHESISTISLETIDIYLKQLEAQKLQAQADISDSIRQLTSLLSAREKQLLRQVDAIHDHLILILQSRKTFNPDAAACCENKEEDFKLEEQKRGSVTDDKSYNVKASPGIDVSLNIKDIEDQIQTFGKVEMTGTSFMHLSEDNETFVFPCRVQNYQETSQDHMLLYKSLETPNSLDPPGVKNEDSARESRDSASTQKLMSPDILNTKEVSLDVFSTDSLKQENPREEDDEGPDKEILKKEKENAIERNDGRLPRKLSEERSEDVQHWMREILNETNSEPTSCDPERFDLFTVLKCNLNKEDIKHEKLNVSTAQQHTSHVSSSDIASEKNSLASVTVDADHLSQQECPAVSVFPSECDLIE